MSLRYLFRSFSYLAIAFGVDEDDVMAAMVVARVYEDRVQSVVRRRLRYLLQIRVQDYLFVEVEPDEEKPCSCNQ